MRIAGTAVACVLAAFGAAFLVARAVDHQSPAIAATTATAAAPVVTTPATTNHELVSEFTPVTSSLRPKPRPRRRHVVHHQSPPVVAAPVQTTPAPTYTTPAVSPPVVSPPVSAPSGSGSGSSSGTTHHTHSGGGSGTTTIGG